MIRHLFLFSLFTITVTACFSQTYTFTGNGNWSIAANWINNTIPPASLPGGDTIYITPAAGDSCVLNIAQIIDSGATLIVATGAVFIIHGELHIHDSVPATTCLPANLQNGVIAYYPFSAGSINDYSGNNYNLLNSTTATSGADRAGNPNCAFDFAGANGEFLKYADPAFINDFQTLPFSISLWYKSESVSAGNYELLIGRDIGGHCPDTHGQWSIGLYDLRNPVFGINEYSLWYNTLNLTTPWKHLVVTCLGTDLKLYINGLLTTQSPGTGCSIPVPTLNVGDLFLGDQYTGSLDDIIIYNRVLSVTEIDQLYNLPACCL